MYTYIILHTHTHMYNWYLNILSCSFTNIYKQVETEISFRFKLVFV